jgi:hypothetical protein
VLQLLVALLPRPNGDTLWTLLAFLNTVAQHSADTTSTHTAVSVVSYVQASIKLTAHHDPQMVNSFLYQKLVPANGTGYKLNRLVVETSHPLPDTSKWC